MRQPGSNIHPSRSVRRLPQESAHCREVEDTDNALNPSLARPSAALPTSRVIPFAGVVTSISPGSTGQTLQLQLWDAATGGTNLFAETQALDVDANGAISFYFGAATSAGLDPTIFPSGYRPLRESR